MRYPLLPVLIAYGAGLLAAEYVALPLKYLFGAALLAIFGGVVVRRAGNALMLLAVFLAGFVPVTLERSMIPGDDLRRRLSDEAQEVVLRGTLAETPEHRVSEPDHLELWRTVAKVRTTAIYLKTSAEWYPASGTVLATTRDILAPEFFRGQPVEIQGVIRRPKAALAPGLFDYRAYLRRLNIHYQLFGESTNDWTLTSPSRTVPLADRFHRWAKSLLAHGLGAEDENLRLLWAMTLGWKTALTGDVSEPFVRSGTMHVFAISGLHITLITAILFGVLRSLGIPRGYAGYGVILLTWFYTYATGMQSSGVRSAIMTSVLVAGFSLKRPANMLNSLCAAALLILLWEPQQIFQAGFQLSFSVVLALILFTPILEALKRKLFFREDPFLPHQLRPKLNRWIAHPVHFVSAGVVTSLAAWIGSMPVIAYYFHVWNPISLVANLLVVPISSVALACNVLTLAAGWIYLPCAGLLNHTAWGSMKLMVRLSEWAANLDWGVYYVRSPDVVTFVVYYTLILCIMNGWLIRQASRKMAATCLVASGLAWGGFNLPSRPGTVLTALPLAGGAAIHIQAKGKHTLVDCGDEDNARWITKPFLRAQGANRLAHFVLTHGDVRHVEAAPRIHELFPASNIYISGARSQSRPYRAVVQFLTDRRAPLKTVSADDEVGPWKVLHPVADQYFSRADDNAIVLYGAFSKSVLLLSDLAPPGQNALVNRYPNLRAKIVITGLPAQGEPVTDGFLDAVQPELIIVCDAELPARERASERLKERLERRGTKVLYTREAAVQLKL